MGIFSYVKAGKKIFGKQKPTGETINPFKRKKMRSDRAAKIGQLKVDLSKLKGGSKKLQTSIDEVRAAMRGKTAKRQKRFSTGKELEQQEYFNKGKGREKKMGGGFAGRRMGYSRGNPKPKTNVEKIKKAFPTKTKIKFDAKKSDLDKSGDLSKYEKARGMAIAKAMAKRNKKA